MGLRTYSCRFRRDTSSNTRHKHRVKTHLFSSRQTWIADDWLVGCVPHGVRLAVAPAVLNAAAPLIWSQMWDLKRVTAVLPVTTAILSGNPQEIWRYFRNRYVSWTAPIPNSQSSNYVLILKRLRIAAIWFMIAVKQGGFSIPSLRTARLSNHRFTQLKELLWK